MAIWPSGWLAIWRTGCLPACAAGWRVGRLAGAGWLCGYLAAYLARYPAIWVGNWLSGGLIG